MNTHSDYSVLLTLVPEFDAGIPSAAELGLVEACIPELIAVLLDAAPVDEE